MEASSSRSNLPPDVPYTQDTDVPRPRVNRPLPPLPFTLQSHILSFLLPPVPPLPLDSLSQVFRHRLIYLPPGETEMDRQLSPFPLPITSTLLTERLERLGKGYELGPEKYGWDGESGLAYRGIIQEGSKAGQAGSDEGMEMQYLYDAHDGWGFHGLRIPGDSARSGVHWVDDSADIDIAAPSDISTSSGASSEMAESSTHSNTNGSLDPYAFTSASYSMEDRIPQGEQGEDGDEVADYWAGFSPPSSPPAETPDLPELDEDERERQYWAQYSAAPSKAASPVLSRQPSSVDVTHSDDGHGAVRADPHREVGADDVAKGSAGGRRDRAGTIKRTSRHQPAAADDPSSTETPDLDTPTASPPLLASPSSSVALLRSRLQMKTLSLLRRAWLDFTAGTERPDELEERGIRWLALARELGSARAGSNGFRLPSHGGEEEVRARTRLEMLCEMHEVYGDEAEEGQGFYRLVEQAMASGGATGNGEGTEERPGGLARTYSFDQQGYWES